MKRKAFLDGDKDLMYRRFISFLKTYQYMCIGNDIEFKIDYVVAASLVYYNRLIIDSARQTGKSQMLLLWGLFNSLECKKDVFYVSLNNRMSHEMKYKLVDIITIMGGDPKLVINDSKYISLDRWIGKITFKSVSGFLMRGHSRDYIYLYDECYCEYDTSSDFEVVMSGTYDQKIMYDYLYRENSYTYLKPDVKLYHENFKFREHRKFLGDEAYHAEIGKYDYV
jgi:hypothetical protein